MESSVLKTGVIFILLFASLCTHAAHFGDHHGYVSNVMEERNKRDVEMVMLDKPKDALDSGVPKIFNEKLSKEFKEQYAYRFGQTNSEQLLNTPHRDDEYTYYTGERLTLEQYGGYQQKFAEYMVRRLVEFHVDDYAKKDRDFRQVYQMKDRISNLDVKVAKYKFKWKYNFAGPSMDLKVDNPYEVDFRVRMDMDGIVSSPAEYIFTTGYPINPRVAVSFVHRLRDGVYQLVGTRRMTRHISTSITGSMDTNRFGPLVQQNLFLLGLSWNE